MGYTTVDGKRWTLVDVCVWALERLVVAVVVLLHRSLYQVDQSYHDRLRVGRTGIPSAFVRHFHLPYPMRQLIAKVAYF